MISNAVLNDPASQRYINQFKTNLRQYWKRNVKKHFSKREEEYGLPVKMNHRLSIAPAGDGSGPRITNALVVNWFPSSGHMMLSFAEIMVKTKNGKRDLVSLLQTGTGRSKKAYRVDLDYRVNRGTRGPQSNDQWNSWITEFVTKVDIEVEKLADHLENRIADMIMEEF